MPPRRSQAPPSKRVTRSTQASSSTTARLLGAGQIVSKEGRGTQKHHDWFTDWSTSAVAKSPAEGWSAKAIWKEVSTYHRE